MITAKALDKESGDQVLILGLTRKEVERLMESDDSITLTSQSEGTIMPLGLKVIIVYAETDEDHFQAMAQSGAMAPDTIVSDMRKEQKS